MAESLESVSLPTASSKERLTALDAFRGLTIAGMILVNNPGNWDHIYAPLEHAPWDGCTPTDLIFPFFLFIMGVAMMFSFANREQSSGKADLLFHVFRRSAILFLLGLILASFPGVAAPKWPLLLSLAAMMVGVQFSLNTDLLGANTTGKFYKILGIVILLGGILVFAWHWSYFQTAKPIVRVPGVLQRIALCYLFGSLILLGTKSIRARIYWCIGLLVVYWVALKLLPAPDTAIAKVPSIAQWHNWLDEKLLGSHLLNERPDPEGLLSTIPAIATTLAGALCGSWLKSGISLERRLLGMFVVGNLLILAGILWDYDFPMNKKIWTSSYVVYTAGMALVFLAISLYLMDYLGYKRWATPFLIFGTNAIVVFFASGLLARVLMWATIDGMNLKVWLCENVFKNLNVISPSFASFSFAASYLILWFLLTWPLYHHKIFIKI